MSQYLSRIEGSPPKRNAVGSIPIWDAKNPYTIVYGFLLISPLLSVLAVVLVLVAVLVVILILIVVAVAVVIIIVFVLIVRHDCFPPKIKLSFFFLLFSFSVVQPYFVLF